MINVSYVCDLIFTAGTSIKSEVWLNKMVS